MNNDDKNVLKMYNDGLDSFMQTIEDVSKIENIKIKSVDFLSKEISVETISNGTNFSDVLNTINFCRLANYVQVKYVDFISGTIELKWLGDVEIQLKILGISKSEIYYIQNGDKIQAIREIRARTNFGLAETKRLVEKAVDILEQNKKTQSEL